MTIIVANRAGGGYDTYARAFAPALSAASGARVDVVNVPGGGGRIALSQVAKQSSGDLLLLIENFADLAGATEGDPEFDVKASEFVALGVIISEPTAWLGRSDIDLSDPDLTNLVASASSLTSNLIKDGLVARALGIDMSVVAGYGGSSETAAAVMRGEADVTSQTITTVLRNVAGTGLKTVLVLSDTSDERAPDAAVLAGPNGLVELRAKGLDEAEKAARRSTAEQAMSLTTVSRAFLSAASLGDATVACLRAATDIALVDPKFVDTATAQGRPVDTRGSDFAAQSYLATVDAYTRILPELETMAKELSD